MMKILNKIFGLILLSILLISCVNNNFNVVGDNNLYSDTVNHNIQAVVPIQLQVQPHNVKKYYTSVSDNSEYIAFSLKWTGNININSIKLESNDNNLFEIVTSSTAYGVNQCQANAKNSGSECEIMVHLTNPFLVNSNPSYLVVVAGGMSLKKTLTTNGGYAYIAGDFTQTYANGSLPAINQESGIGYCGPNNNARCQILKYDFANNTLTSVASTDYAINDIAIDNDNNMYIGGIFNNFKYNNTIIDNGDTSGVSSLLVKLTFTESGVVPQDWLKSISTNFTYPNGGVNAIEFNSKTNKIYIAGAFQSIANYTTNNGFPLLEYNLNNNNGTFANALGDDINNPDTSITAIGIDSNSNMYLSGFYSQLSNFVFNDGFSARTINKCILNNDIYTCLTGSSYSMSITSNEQYVQPAYSLTFQSNGGLYAAGGFTHMYYAGSSIQEILGYESGPNLVAFNSDPITSFVNNPTNNWTNLVDKADNTAPDNVIGVISPYEDGKYYIGGQFSTIGGILSDNNKGECGTNGTSSCLLAKFDGTNWSKLFTTDGVINSFVIVAGIEVK